MSSEKTYGLLLPNFGEDASDSMLLETGQRAEAIGLDRLWIRDHLFWHPHGFEQSAVGSDPTFVEPFNTLSAIGAVTDDIGLATAVAIPLRHPLHLAQLYASLDFMSGGNDRVVAGVGAGHGKHEFDAVNLPYEKRAQMVVENMQIMDRIWKEDEISYDGEVYSFDEAEINPKPSGDLPIWYGGDTPASVRRAVNHADGWIPGRINVATMKARVNQLEEMSEEQGRDRPTVGHIPIVSIDENSERASEQVNLDGLLDTANSREWWISPSGDEFTSADDLEGGLLAGTPAEVVEGVERLHEVGVDHLVFDFRFRFDEIDKSLELLGDEVLPELP